MKSPSNFRGEENILSLDPDLQINYVDEGEGFPLIFLHNSGGFWQIWQKQLAFFSKKYRVIALDFPNNGKSSLVEKEELSLSYFTSILDQFLKKLKIKEFSLIGNCIGATVALNYSQTHSSKVKHLLLFNICPGIRLGSNLLEKSFIWALWHWPWLRSLSFPLLQYLREKSFHRNKFPSILFAPDFNPEDPFYLELKAHLDSYDGHPLRFKDLYALHSYSYQQYRASKLNKNAFLFWAEKNQVTSIKSDAPFFSKKLNLPIIPIKSAGHLCMYEQAELVNQKIDSILI
jgi:pimeloyl-ACP methyl ester carboxylesterase